MAEVQVKEIGPQPGYQLMALSSSADIVIGGGAAGVGKTFTLLLDPLRDIDVDGFGGVIFRRTSPQIRNEGGLWDTSMGLYTHMNAKARESLLEWVFESGSKLKFSHLEHEKNIYDWQGSQIPFIGFDELTHFTKKMFFYMLSRNRSVCGVKPYVRATCNPDPDSWVADFIKWWIDQDTGFPIREREGVVRYMVVDGDNYIWGDTFEEAREKAWHILEPVVTKGGIDPKHLIKSVTFISGSIYDNKELLKVDPAYIGNLLSQDNETKAALLEGNWKVVLSDEDIYDYASFLGIFHNSIETKTEERYITADIALKGSDKFVVMVWYGKELVDILIMNKSKGNEVIDGIKDLARKHKVQNKNIVFDNDGVGQFIDGFIDGAKEFNNGARPLPSPEKPMKDKKGNPIPEQYEHLKAQCYYRSGASVSRGEYKVSEEVQNRMYDDKMTVRQRLLFERKAIKEGKKDINMKLCLLRKDEQKAKLNGQSPDMMDCFMMREFFELKRKPIPIHSKAALGI